MTYNVHSCVGIDGQCAPERIAAVICEANADVVCLQEVDVGRPRTGRLDQAERIAQILTMDFHFNPLIEEVTGRYGDAILSKSPFSLIRAGAFPPVPRPLPKESRGAIWIETTVDGRRWQIINTHLGLGHGERRLQAAALLQEWVQPAMAQSPVVLCGDFNSRPASTVHRTLGETLSDAVATKGQRHPQTFSTPVPFVCLDYIYVSDPQAVRSVSLHSTALSRKASDHFPLVAELTPA
jgi:endonuclease/exonuclease/phosphatase family metal-dependent hydrolase